MELEALEAEVFDAFSLIAQVRAAHVDGTEGVETGLVFQFARQPVVGINPCGVALMGKGSETDCLVELAGIEQAQKSVDAARLIDRWRKNVSVVDQARSGHDQSMPEMRVWRKKR